ncbi:MAG: HYR domain-containing protein [Gemmatimonadetes bacterium]|nr:HYR domain-containing protein [Gemmatimonadota bacterium]
MRRTAALCLLVLLSVLATASKVHAQAVLNPNQISGQLAFTNQNPEILNIFDRNGLNQGFSSAWVRADSIGITPALNNYTFPQAESGTSIPYEITVESSADGIAYRVTAWAYLRGYGERYHFESIESDLVTPEPSPDVSVDIAECAGVLDIGWVDSNAHPVAVQGFDIRAFRESVAGSSRFNIVQAQSWLWSGNTSQTYVMVRGDGADYELSIYYDSGTDPYSNKIRGLCKQAVTVSCDEIVKITCMLPPPGELGAIMGTIDMLGEEETPTGFVRAEWGPLRNSRWDFLRDPSSGPFALENLVVSAAEDPAKGYTVWGDINFRTGYRAEQFRTPWLRDVMVEGSQTTDLGDALVIDPAFQVGNITLAGPPVDAGASCLQTLYRDESLDRDGNWIPGHSGVNSSHVRATGSWRAAAGASHSASGGWARSRFEGAFDEATTAFRGDYELLLGGINGESSLWNTGDLILTFRGDLSDPLNYQYSRMYLTDRAVGEQEFRPGEALQVDFDYCMSEVNLSFHSLSGSFYSPNARGSGRFQSTDFEGAAVDQTFYLSYAYGSPSTPTAASNAGLVAMCLPQGSYTLTPTVTAINPNGSTSNTELPPVTVDVGCRQVIELTPELQVNLAELPQCTPEGDRQIAGSVNGSESVDRIFYTHNGGSEIDVCTSCGSDPSFSIDLALQECDNEIQVTAVDILGNQASVKTVIRKTRFDAEAPVVSGANDISVELAAGEVDAKVDFGLSATDNCDTAVQVNYDPPSGYFFSAATTEISYEAHDVCQNSTSGTFQVSVSQYVEPAPEPEPVVEEPVVEEPVVEEPADEEPAAEKHGNRSGLADGTNPGLGKGRVNSPNQGTENPNQSDADKSSRKGSKKAS